MTTSSMSAFVAEGKERLGIRKHNRIMNSVREEAANLVIKSQPQISYNAAIANTQHISDEQIYAAARQHYFASHSLSADANVNPETWWEWFKRVALPEIIKIAKIVLPILLMLLVAGS